MKKIISLLIALAALVCAAPTAISGDDPAAFIADTASGAVFDGDTVVFDEPVSAAEALSCFKNRNALSITSPDGAPLDLADSAAGARIVCGEQSMTVVERGDATADGKFNARDVIAAMLALVGGEAVGAAGDVTADASLNAHDVVAMMRRLAGYDVLFGEGAALASSGDADIDLYFDSLMHRVSQRDTEIHGVAAGVFRMAKDEIEDAQLVIVSRKQIAEVTVDVGPLTNADGAVLETKLLNEYYYNLSIYKDILGGKRFQSPMQGGPHAEALPKLLGTIDLQKDESHGIVVQIKTAPEDASGWYSAPITLTSEGGEVLKEAILRVYVWNFTLDETPAMDTAVGFNFGSVHSARARQLEKETGRDYLEIINDREFSKDNESINKEYLDLFLDARISPYHLPYDVTDARCDEIMSDPRLTSFCVYGGGNYHNVLKADLAEGSWPASDDDIIATYRKLAQNEDWLHKAYVYYVDEPSTLNVYLAKEVKNHIDGVLNSTDDLKDLEWHQVVPMGGNDFFTDEFGIKTDESDYVYRYVDIMIPQSYAFTKWYSNAERKAFRKENGYDPLGIPGIMTWLSAETWKVFPEQWQTRYDRYADEGGLRRWWYICCSPEPPYPNYFTYYQGPSQRVTFWQQYMFHVEGFLYWATQDKWDKTTLTDFPTNGDGVLLYWGELFGQTGPVTSVRWEYIRDGIEDFQYFSQLERAGLSREEIVSTYINRVTTSILEFEPDDHAPYEQARAEMGYLLESLSGE